ncbi:hypothetical protein K6V90_26080 [Cupriavidus pauculus]|uniref:hypothetical protein n=1 Tax=Cupriavidus pauculus TaxID=82633 RepID=UPI001C932B50|nr:hypothetical protein [Cupriavidus pauculus]MBY4734013.1 hypothetical protein [Cupriavidus pauculus]
MSESLRQRLMAKTANLADKVEVGNAARTPISEQRPVTMPGQLGAFRLEAQRYVATINELKAQLEEARAIGGSIEIQPVESEFQKTQSVTFKIGRSVYCKMRQAKNVVRLEFQTDADAGAMYNDFKVFLEAKARQPVTPDPEGDERLNP